MKKKELMTLAPPEMSAYLREIAKKDIPIQSKSCDSAKKYKYGRYLRAKMEKGYLMVSVFMAEHVRAGAKLPAYVVYFDQKADDFITFETDSGRWLKSMLENLNWPYYMYDSGTYISKREAKLIREYLKKDTGDYYGLLQFQRDVRERQLEARYKKITDVWDEAMKPVPGLPKDWNQWLLRHVITEHYLFYEYRKGGATEGYCTHCGKMVPINNPKYNQMGRCSRCGQSVQFKSVGKAGSIWTERKTAYLIQRCGPGIVLRRFEAWLSISEEDFFNPDVEFHETKRFLYDEKFNMEPYYYGLFRNRYSRWIHGECSGYWGVYSFYYYHTASLYGMVYPRTLPDLGRKELKQTGLNQWIKRNPVSNPFAYLETWKKIPVLEQVLKAELPRLTDELMDEPEKLSWQNSGGGLAKRLKIDNEKLKRLRELDGGLDVLSWLQQEKKENICLSNEMISWFLHHNILPEYLDFIRDRMSYVQIKNYLVRQQQGQKDSIIQVLMTWRDYLSMAKRLKMNVYDAIVYRTSKLYQRHEELVKYMEENKLSVKADELGEKFPYIHDILPGLQEKYGFSNKTYTILAPKKIEDILEEGQALHHCIDKKEEYFERINNQESYILFLRKTRKPNQPYYTLEVEPGGVIRQKRTEFDRQKEDIQKASGFLRKWQAEIQKRMTKEDRNLARKSKETRIESYAAMRKKKVRINGGLFRGQFLADVLEADLMELPDTGKKAA